MNLIVAQISVVPIGVGTSVGKYVRACHDILEESGVSYVAGAMSTYLEVEELDALFDIVRGMRDRVIGMGAERLIVDLKFDDRRDRESSILSKLNAVKRGLS